MSSPCSCQLQLTTKPTARSHKAKPLSLCALVLLLRDPQHQSRSVTQAGFVPKWCHKHYLHWSCQLPNWSTARQQVEAEPFFSVRDAVQLRLQNTACRGSVTRGFTKGIAGCLGCFLLPASPEWGSTTPFPLTKAQPKKNIYICLAAKKLNGDAISLLAASLFLATCHFLVWFVREFPPKSRHVALNRLASDCLPRLEAASGWGASSELPPCPLASLGKGRLRYRGGQQQCIRRYIYKSQSFGTGIIQYDLKHTPSIFPVTHGQMPWNLQTDSHVLWIDTVAMAISNKQQNSDPEFCPRFKQDFIILV